jgi:hypothetical protein
MEISLNSKSIMECAIHGRQKPAFICQHLQHGFMLGFLQADEAPSNDAPWEMAWCDACEVVRRQAGGWNDESEGYAAARCVCYGCFLSIRMKNEKQFDTQKSRVRWRAWFSKVLGGQAE